MFFLLCMLELVCLPIVAPQPPNAPTHSQPNSAQAEHIGHQPTRQNETNDVPPKPIRVPPMQQIRSKELESYPPMSDEVSPQSNRNMPKPAIPHNPQSDPLKPNREPLASNTTMPENDNAPQASNKAKARAKRKPETRITQPNNSDSVPLEPRISSKSNRDLPNQSKAPKLNMAAEENEVASLINDPDNASSEPHSAPENSNSDQPNQSNAPKSNMSTEEQKIALRNKQDGASAEHHSQVTSDPQSVRAGSDNAKLGEKKSGLLDDIVDDFTHPEKILDAIAHPEKILDAIPDTLLKLLPEPVRQQFPIHIAELLKDFSTEMISDMANSAECRAARDLLREAGYPRAFLSAFLMLPMLLLSLSKNKISPDSKEQFKDEYDYIVVGGGTAGSVVASRLSERSCVSVALLEAGGKPPLLTDVPTMAPVFFLSDLDWQYLTVPLKNTGRGLVDKKQQWNSGKVLGGGSILNAMISIRGNRRDYDNWERQGAQGWGYKDVLPYFIKLENETVPEYLENGFHAVGGPMTLERPPYVSPLKKPLMEAVKELGYKFVDVNGEHQTGFFDYEATMRNGQRCSTAKAYLVPAENRTNLDILLKATVLKVLIENKRAVGVEFVFKGSRRAMKARKEVILSAGAIGSAQLLILSGVGPKDQLKKLGINLEADLKVGENLQEHISAPMILELSISKIAPDLVTLVNPLNQLDYIARRTNNMAGSFGGQMTAFLSRDGPHPKDDYPDYQLYFGQSPKFIMQRAFHLSTEFYEKVLKPYTLTPALECMSEILRPRSSGFMRLTSTDLNDMPLIDPQYLTDPHDMQCIVAGLRTCRKLCATSAMRDMGCKEISAVYPGCEGIERSSDKYLECMVQTWTITMWHRCGTAKMGSADDPSAVVDPQLRVKGIRGLRVVDTSVMPNITSGNTNVPAIMIAEKAADMIKKNIPCKDIPHVLEGVHQPAKKVGQSLL